MAQIRTLIADDHPLFREGVALLLQPFDDIAVAGLARDGVEAVALADELTPDVVVMDDEMPRCGGLEATRVIVRARPAARVVILTATPSEELGGSLTIAARPQGGTSIMASLPRSDDRPEDGA